MKSVTLVGGAGYIGQRLARYLSDHGWYVRIVDPCIVDPEAPRRLEGVANIGEALPEGPIVYLASLHDFPGFDDMPLYERVEWQQVGRRLMVDEPARLAKTGREVIYISSMRALTHPNTFYGRLKGLAEKRLFQMPNVAIRRFGTVFGGLTPVLYNRTITVPNNWLVRGELPDENWKAYVTCMHQVLGSIKRALNYPQSSVTCEVQSGGPWDADRLSRLREITDLGAEREPHPAVATAKYYDLPLPKGLA
jgi:nucleoside-diphosphate-sugar epimerase